MNKDKDAVVVVRDDGKEFTINRSAVAEHINRGIFKVKNKADEPTLEERKRAVGFDLKSAPSQDATVPEERTQQADARASEAGAPRSAAKKVAKRGR